MVLTIRAAKSQDAVAAADLLNAVIRVGGTTAIETELSPEETSDWFLLGSKVHCAFIALENNQMVGWQSVGVYPERGSDWGSMATFAQVGSTTRGIGTAVFATTLGRAAQLGLQHLDATIRADNTGGLAYYSRMGFIDYDVSRAVPLADGTPIDRIHKRRAV